MHGTALVTYAWFAVALVAVGGAAMYERRRAARQRFMMRAERRRVLAAARMRVGCVCDPREAAEMLMQIQRDTARIFGFYLTTPISARFATGPQMHKRCNAPRDEPHPDGLCCWEESGITVFIRQGLPQRYFYAVLAHEYAHVWQRMEGFARFESMERCEGFAEWVSLVLTQAAGHDLTGLFDRAADDYYGTGMRRFAALQQLVGIRKTAEMARNRRFSIRWLNSTYDPLKKKIETRRH